MCQMYKCSKCGVMCSKGWETTSVQVRVPLERLTAEKSCTLSESKESREQSNEKLVFVSHFVFLFVFSFIFNSCCCCVFFVTWGNSSTN